MKLPEMLTVLEQARDNRESLVVDTLDILLDFEFVYVHGSETLRDIDTLQPFTPGEARLTTADGRIVDLDGAPLDMTLGAAERAAFVAAANPRLCTEILRYLP